MKLADVDCCTGCAACVNACPFGALSMRPDVEGFLLPVVEEGRCRKCGKCERACPVVSVVPKPRQIEKIPMCGASSSEEIWCTSTSGGAFTEICLTLDDRKPIIFGARFDGLDHVVHDFVEGARAIVPLRKSKYVQSEVGHSLAKCQAFLREGRTVVFSGTPCQIAGLRGFLCRDYENLVTLEFICHGAGSPSFFRACLREMERRFGKKIVEYGFRSKLKNAQKHEQYTSYYRFCDGAERLISRDLYNRFFLRQLCLRKSCMEQCPFRHPERYADITFADCRGEESLYPRKDGKNWSVIIANTEKGRDIVSKLQERMVLHDYPAELLKLTNPFYYGTTRGNPKRDEFFERFVRGEKIEEIGLLLGVVDPKWKILGRMIKRSIKTILRIGRSHGNPSKKT